MNTVKEGRPLTRRENCIFDPDASTHELLNDATEWLQYAGGVIDLTRDLAHEPEGSDTGRMALAMDAVGALVNLGVQCVLAAHERMIWEEGSASRAPLSDEMLARER